MSIKRKDNNEGHVITTNKNHFGSLIPPSLTLVKRPGFYSLTLGYISEMLRKIILNICIYSE